jgi:hypothetical protein
MKTGFSLASTKLEFSRAKSSENYWLKVSIAAEVNREGRFSPIRMGEQVRKPIEENCLEKMVYRVELEGGGRRRNDTGCSGKQ